MSAFWKANLAALAARSGDAAPLLRWLESVGPAPDLGLRSRQGLALPGLTEGGRARSLISAYDAAVEAHRWAEAQDGGTVAVLGAGGRHAAEALAGRGASLCFWVEPRGEVWRSLFTFEDWSGRAGREDWMPVWGGPADLAAAVKGRYHPLWDGAFRSAVWRGTGEPAGGWEPWLSAAREALEAVAGDASTQARFGERWYRNSLRNLRDLVPARIEGCPGAQVVVAGAGPSLDDALDDPARRRWLDERPLHGGRLYAVDTAFPALGARGIVPDAVFSLDGQLPTYHHFVAPGPTDVPLAADLASLPLLGRLGRTVVRYLSGHPLGAVVRRYFPELPVLDGSLANVSGLARQAASSLGARSVETWGVDFAYRRGQAYARGAYPYDLASRRADRLSPAETRLTSGDYGAASRRTFDDDRGRSWSTTALLRSYRGLWDEPRALPAGVDLAHGGAAGRWEAFAEDWRRRLTSLPLPPSALPMQVHVRRLSAEAREDWWALWPLALALHRTGVPAAEAAEAARGRALALLEV